MTVSTIADLETPTSLFLKLGALKPAFLLESVTHGEKVGRYSFIGLDPIKRVDYRGGARLCDVISRELEGLGAPDASAHALCRGLVGAVAYENVHEMLPTGVKPRAQDQPLASFVAPRAVVVFDHAQRRIEISHRDGEVAARSLLSQVRAAMGSPIAALPSGGELSSPRASLEEPAFHKLVARAKEHIRKGDIFQVVLSLAFEGTTTLHPYQVYRALRHLNPSPYLYYLNLGDTQIIGSSPEALLKLQNGELTIRPIAGTRPRGIDEGQDRALEAELRADPKENAEHNMLVDLGRNDIGRVADIGSVKVPDLRVVERYSHVMHLCSTVTGRLSPKHAPLAAFASAFPAGTVSGAPKIRALQIIDELEAAPRGFYAGSVGYFTASGDFDQAICIRTIVMRNGHYTAQAGAGIVADSDPAAEYQEIRNKAAALLKSLEFAREEL